jgi:hypothetical protein
MEAHFSVIVSLIAYTVHDARAFLLVLILLLNSNVSQTFVNKNSSVKIHQLVVISNVFLPAWLKLSKFG